MAGAQPVQPSTMGTRGLVEAFQFLTDIKDEERFKGRLAQLLEAKEAAEAVYAKATEERAQVDARLKEAEDSLAEAIQMRSEVQTQRQSLQAEKARLQTERATYERDMAAQSQSLGQREQNVSQRESIVSRDEDDLRQGEARLKDMMAQAEQRSTAATNVLGKLRDVLKEIDAARV